MFGDAVPSDFESEFMSKVNTLKADWIEVRRATKGKQHETTS
jgi:hypothetical protein